MQAAVEEFMHPGRKWANDTLSNQAERHEIEAHIAGHFAHHPIIKDKAALFEKLSLS